MAVREAGLPWIVLAIWKKLCAGADAGARLLIFPGGPIRLAAPFAASPSVDDQKADPHEASCPTWGLELRALPDTRCPKEGGVITRSRIGRRTTVVVVAGTALPRIASGERKALNLLESTGYEAEGFRCTST